MKGKNKKGSSTIGVIVAVILLSLSSATLGYIIGVSKPQINPEKSETEPEPPYLVLELYRPHSIDRHFTVYATHGGAYLANFTIYQKPDLIIGQIYYDTATSQFTQQRGLNENKNLVFGGYCNYYSDAKTVKSTIPLPISYVQKNLLEVTKIEDFADYNEIGWIAKPYSEVDIICVHNDGSVITKEFCRNNNPKNLSGRAVTSDEVNAVYLCNYCGVWGRLR